MAPQHTHVLSSLHIPVRFSRTVDCVPDCVLYSSSCTAAPAVQLLLMTYCNVECRSLSLSFALPKLSKLLHCVSSVPVHCTVHDLYLRLLLLRPFFSAPPCFSPPSPRVFFAIILVNRFVLVVVVVVVIFTLVLYLVVLVDRLVSTNRRRVALG